MRVSFLLALVVTIQLAESSLTLKGPSGSTTVVSLEQGLVTTSSNLSTPGVRIEKSSTVSCKPYDPFTFVRDNNHLLFCHGTYLEPVDSTIGTWPQAYSPVATVTVDEIPLKRAYPRMCRDVMPKPTTNGWFWIWPADWDGPVQVYCDFEMEVTVNNPETMTLRGFTQAWWGCGTDPFGNTPTAQSFFPYRPNAAIADPWGGTTRLSRWVGYPLFRKFSVAAEYIMWANMSSIDPMTHIPADFIINDVAGLNRKRAIWKTVRYGTPHFDPGNEHLYFTIQSALPLTVASGCGGVSRLPAGL